MRHISIPLIIVAMIGLCVVFAPSISPYPPSQIFHILQSPNSQHLLGTDALGRDVASRLLYGGRHTLFMAALATFLAVSVGTLLGLFWGILPRSMAGLFTAMMSAILALPGLLIAIIFITLLGRGTMQIALAVGLAQIAHVAQVMRGVTVSVKHAPYIESAYAIGTPFSQIIYRHILPNLWPTVFVYIGIIFGYSILNGAALTFLGLGELGTPDWGVMLAEGRAVFDEAPWVSLFPGMVITAFVFSINTVSNRLR
jgi:peptide/nickel transport system permease protein